MKTKVVIVVLTSIVMQLRILVQGDCPQERTGRLSGSLKSPNYPLNYPMWTSCSLTLTAHNGGVIAVGFDAFNLEGPTFSICTDKVVVYNGLTQKLGTFCGTDLPLPMVSTGRIMKIEFSSDTFFSGTGFHAVYQATDGNLVCGSSFVTGSSGYIRSPNYPNNYPANTHCVWRIVASSGTIISLEFVSWSLQTGCGFDNDNVTVYNQETHVLGTFCGATAPSTVFSTGRRMKVTFNSDLQVQSSGFILKWTARTSTYSCGSTQLTASSGILKSPNYPLNYPHNVRCVWRISASFNQRIRIIFNHLRIESTYNCASDRLNVYDGETSLIASYCQYGEPGDIESTGSSVKIEFVSDNSVAYTGFQLRWTTFTTPRPTFTTPTASSTFPTPTLIPVYTCGSEPLAGSTGVIISPNYPSNYPNLASCTWRIYGAVGLKIRLRFEDFDVESSAGCRRDYVEVYDGENILVSRHCGNSRPSDVISTSLFVKVTFNSDVSRTRKGFRISWTISRGGQLTPSAVVMATLLLVALSGQWWWK